MPEGVQVDSKDKVEEEEADDSFEAAPKKKVFKSVERFSPDLLFMRSILYIYNPDATDFADYKCTATSSNDKPDELVIKLRQSATAGELLRLI